MSRHTGDSIEIITGLNEGMIARGWADLCATLTKTYD